MGISTNRHEIIDNTDEATKKAWPYIVKAYGTRGDLKARLWGYGFRTDSYGNNRACKCPELLKLDTFCVCYGVCYCPNCGHCGCVGGHD